MSSTSAPSPRWAPLVAELDDGRAFIFGGTDVGAFGGGVFAQSFLFDANDGTFTDLGLAGDLPDPRYCGCAAFHPGENAVFVLGGRDLGGTMGAGANAFDLDEQRWTRVGEGPVASLGCAATYHAASDAIYVFGGANNAGSTNDLYRVDLASGAFTPIAYEGGPSPRYDAELFSRGDTLVVGWLTKRRPQLQERCVDL